MSRLYDRIMAGGFRPPHHLRDAFPTDAWLKIQNSTTDMLREAQVIAIDNVTDYLFTKTDQETWDLKKDFPCVAPPFPTFWMETNAPKISVSKEHGTKSLSLGNNIWHHDGFLFRYTDAPVAQQVSLQSLGGKAEIFRQQAMASFTIFGESLEHKVNMYGEDSYAHLTKQEKQGLSDIMLYGLLERGDTLSTPDDVRWYATVWAFIEIPKGHIYGPSVQWEFAIDGDGRIMDDRMGAVGIPGAEKPDLDAIGCLNPMIFSPLLALSFMHCKNVKVIINEPPIKLNKAYQKKRGKPLVRYYTLEIEPMKEVLRREGDSEKLGLKRALHICRGHFATYTEERPLFGRVAGRFFIPMHRRGSVKEGAIIKDYAVKALETE